MASKFRLKYEWISRFISERDLQREDKNALNFSEADLFDLNIPSAVKKNNVDRRFLGFYTKSGIKFALKRYGLLNELRQKGFENILIFIDTDDPYRQRLSIYYDVKQADHLLGEVVCRLHYLKLDMPEHPPIHQQRIKVLYIEWMTLQNPTKTFHPSRPRLPGQKYPGLGIGYQVYELLVLMAKRLKCEAVLNVPEHYHNAIIYAKEFFFLNPHYEGLLLALQRDLSETYSVATISAAVDDQRVLNTASGETLQWFTSEQITPLSRRLLKYFETDYYRRNFKIHYQRNHYKISD
jgi:hypothetical protein